jgi:hypothetical protein
LHFFERRDHPLHFLLLAAQFFNFLDQIHIEASFFNDLPKNSLELPQRNALTCVLRLRL